MIARKPSGSSPQLMPLPAPLDTTMPVSGHPKITPLPETALLMPLLPLQSETPFPQLFPLQIPQLPTEHPYPAFAAPDLLNHLRAPRLHLPASPTPVACHKATGTSAFSLHLSHHLPHQALRSSGFLKLHNTPQACTLGLSSHSLLSFFQGLPTLLPFQILPPTPFTAQSANLVLPLPSLLTHLKFSHPTIFLLYREPYLPPFLPLTSSTH